MFGISISVTILISTALILKAFISLKRNEPKVAAPLIVPFFIYNMIILISKNRGVYLENYLDQQIFTISLGFFSVYSMLTVFYLRKITDDSKK